MLAQIHGHQSCCGVRVLCSRNELTTDSIPNPEGDSSDRRSRTSSWCQALRTSRRRFAKFSEDFLETCLKLSCRVLRGGYGRDYNIVGPYSMPWPSSLHHLKHANEPKFQIHKQGHPYVQSGTCIHHQPTDSPPRASLSKRKSRPTPNRPSRVSGPNERRWSTSNVHPQLSGPSVKHVVTSSPPCGTR